MEESTSYTAFKGHRHLATGTLRLVLQKVIEDGDEEQDAPLLIFDDETGRQVDFDLRGSLDEVLARALPAPKKPGPGRPRLGVSSAEVTLLPRHWDWLDSQPQKASGSLRRLVDAAMKTPDDLDLKRRRIAAAGAFLWSMAGNFENFEEATRCLYASKWRELRRLAALWPVDLRNHLEWLLRDLPAEGEAARMSFRGRRIEAMKTSPRRRASPSEGGETWRLSAIEIADGVSSGRFTALEVMETQLARIERINPELHALTVVFADKAREAARKIDERIEAGDPVGPLAGLPFSVKENIDVAGYATTHGIPAMRGSIPPRDAPLVERLREAGAIPIAHSNLPDLSLRFHTKSQLYGATLNPWDASLSPGGSSEGEGAASAAGLSPLGLGNDAGGSVRIPSVLNGICSLKPGYGRFPSDRSVGPRDLTLASQLIPVDGILARSVADLHRVYQVAAGPDPRDPRVAPTPLFGPPLGGAARVALVFDPAGVRSAPEVRAALLKAAAALEAAGYRVEAAEPPALSEIVDAYGRMIMTEFEAGRAMLDRLLGADGRRYIEYATALRKPVDLQGYLDLTAKLQGFRRQWAEFLEVHPLILGPVLTEAAFPADFDIRGPEEHARLSRSMGLCSATSFVGVPAVSFPVEVRDGLPLGAQLIASFYREDLCLEAAGVVEAALGTFTPVDPRRARRRS
jgi:amidase